jgi:hypothetical protein
MSELKKLKQSKLSTAGFATAGRPNGYTHSIKPKEGSVVRLNQSSHYHLVILLLLCSWN